MRLICSIYLCCICSLWAYSQKVTIGQINEEIEILDSLKNSDIREALNLSDKCLSDSKSVKYDWGIAKVLVSRGWSYYRLGEIDSSLNQLWKAKKLIPILKDSSLHAIIYSSIGVVYQNIAQYDSSEYYHKLNLKIGRSIHDKERIISGLVNLGAVSYNKNDFEASVQYHYDALEVCGENCSISRRIYFHNNIGSVYIYQGRYVEALKEYEACKDLSIEAKDYNRIVSSHNSIGNVHYFETRYDAALKSFQKALSLAEEREIKRGIMNANLNIGKTLIAQGKLKNAIQYFKTSIDYSKKVKNQSSQTFCWLKLGEIYKEVKDVANSIQAYENALDIAQENNFAEEISTSAFALSHIYESKNDLIQALAYQKILNKIQDTVIVQEKYLLKSLFEAEKLENKLSLLQRQQQESESRINLQKGVIIILIIVLLAVGGIVFLIIQKNTVYKHLVNRNKELAEEQLKKSEKNNVPKYTNSNLSTDQLEDLYQKIIQLFEEKKIFVNKDFSLAFIAEELDTNSSYLSRVINERFGQNFNAVLNEYRIKEARKMLLDKKNDEFTIEFIADAVGFRSKSTFNIAFKKHTGLTPSYFRKSIEE